MGVTYDAPSNVITVEGFTEEAPCTFEDVYQADVAGGWGVVTKPNAYMYCFTAHLYVDDGTTPASYFADENKVASFLGETYFAPRRQGHIRLGAIANESEKTTKNGCTLLTDHVVGTGKNFISMNGVWVNTFDLYGCTIMAPNGNIGVMLGQYSKCWNSHFIGAIIGQANKGEFYHVTIMSGTPVWRPTGGTYEDITIIEPTGVALYRPVSDLTNLNVINPQSTVINLHGGSRDYNFIDCILDPWTFTYGTFNYRIYRQYTFNLKVVDSSGTGVNAATVTLTDKEDLEIFSVSTGADGTITEQTVSRGYYNQANGSTLQDYSPHKLVIVKTGYQALTIEGITLDKFDWTLELLTEAEFGLIVDRLPFAVEVASPSLSVEVAS